MKWVIVTGESGGLGARIAERLLQEEEYGVIGISRRETDQILSLKKLYGESYHHLSFDISHTDAIKELYVRQIKPIGQIYGLVNNAAVAYDDIVTNANIEKLDYMFRVNVQAPIMLTKFAIRDMILHHTKGSIVHISSVSAHTGFKGLSMYGSTKGALESFSKGVSREWGHAGIRSNCVTPGFMETDMSGTLSSEQREKIYRRHSLAGPTEVASVANTALFLLSEQAKSITGTVVHVDNGAL